MTTFEKITAELAAHRAVSAACEAGDLGAAIDALPGLGGIDSTAAGAASIARVVAEALAGGDDEAILRVGERHGEPLVRLLGPDSPIRRFLADDESWDRGVGLLLAGIDVQATVLASRFPAMWHEWVAGGSPSLADADDPEVPVALSRWSWGAALAGECVDDARLVLGGAHSWPLGAHALTVAFAALPAAVRNGVPNRHQAVAFVSMREQGASRGR